MPAAPYSDEEAAQALTRVVGASRWEAVALARGYLAALGGEGTEAAARVVHTHGTHTLKRSRELIERARETGLVRILTPREKTGSAENPITKMFPAAITEQRFLEVLDELTAARPSVGYSDERDSGGLADFTLREGELALPTNVKTAGTRFERAQDLVGLEPDDCVPIPAYKAHAAVEETPNLLYVVSVDYELLGRLNPLLAALFDRDERIVWDLLNRYAGAGLRGAEDTFVSAMVRKHWGRLREAAGISPFFVISARRAIRVLQTKPRRTPGIGLRAWGTGARAEVNVHVSVREDMTPWGAVADRIRANGVPDIVQAVNRRRTEEVYDPEI